MKRIMKSLEYKLLQKQEPAAHHMPQEEVERKPDKKRYGSKSHKKVLEATSNGVPETKRSGQ